jgi:competence protein ComGF
MTISSYDPYLLITTSKDTFSVVRMQTDDTLFLGLEQFAALKEEELIRAKLTAKPRDELTFKSPLILINVFLR